MRRNLYSVFAPVVNRRFRRAMVRGLDARALWLFGHSYTRYLNWLGM